MDEYYAPIGTLSWVPEGTNSSMPTYGSAKRRDIIRSVLPSKARRGARENLAAIKRKNRRAIRRDLAVLARQPADVDVVDAYLDTEDDFTHYPDGEIRYAMWERRGADKLAPLIRWGVESTKHKPIEDRLPSLRALLPDNTIGRHAYSHLVYIDGLEDERTSTWRWYRQAPRPGVSARANRWELRKVLTKRLAETGDGHRWLNKHFFVNPLTRVSDFDEWFDLYVLRAYRHQEERRDNYIYVGATEEDLCWLPKHQIEVLDAKLREMFDVDVWAIFPPPKDQAKLYYYRRPVR